MERDSSEPEDVDTGPVTFDLVELRRLTNLGGHTVETAFQVFAGAADEYGIISCMLEYGIISCTAFNRCFRELADPRSESDAEALSFLPTGLYDIFNSDKNGAVDFTELSSNLSVLCGGDLVDKAEAAFKFYEYKGDSVISMGKMRLVAQGCCLCFCSLLEPGWI